LFIDNDDYAEHDVSGKAEYKQADDDIVEEDVHDNVHGEDIKDAAEDCISLVDHIPALVDLFYSYLRVLASYFEDQ
jgi:hypothetical protein